MAEAVARKRRRRKWPWIVLTTILAALVAFVLLVPSILVWLSPFSFSRDLSDVLPPDVAETFSNRTVSVTVRFSRHNIWDIAITGEGRLLDWPVSIDARLNESIMKLSAEGIGTVSVNDGTPRLDFKFAGSAFGGWTASCDVPEFQFSNEDGGIGTAIARIVASSPTTKEFTISGNARASFSASTTNAVPEWGADVWMKDANTSIVIEDDDEEVPYDIRGLSYHAGATGYGKKTEIKPLFPRVKSIEVAGFALSNAFASVRATDNTYLITEAGTDVCGGKARIYALFLRPDKLDAGFTLLLDDIDAGMALERLAGFKGEASGRLHGKLPVRISNGNVMLGDAFLHSFPGEAGRIKLRDSSAFTDKLALAGIPESDRTNVSKALKDMTYDVISLDLNKVDDETHRLSLKVEGKAKGAKTEVPVNLNININGDIHALLNTGIMAKRKMKEINNENKNSK